MLRKSILLSFIYVLFNTLTGIAATYYVDPVKGNDSDTGVSPEAAWQSLTKINATVFAPGDTILFKANGTWNGQLFPQGSGIAGKPIIIDKYGSGSKPLITGGGIINYVVWLKNQDYWEINNLEITNPSSSEGDRLGVRISADDGNEHRHIFLQKLEIHDVMGYYTFETKGKNTGGIGIRITGGGSNTRFDSLLIDGCEIHHVVRVGISSNSSQAGDLERNGDQPITNFIIRNNSIHHTAGDGLILRMALKPLVEHNVAYENHNGNESTVSYGVALWCRSTDSAIFQYNEVYNTRGVLDGQAFDADFNALGTVFQYNYSHDNEGGFLLLMNGTRGTIVRYNISEDDGAKSVHVFHFAEYDPGGNPTRAAASIYNNTFYVPSNAVFSDRAMANSSFKNNIIYRTVSGTIQNASGGQTAVWDHNCIYESTSLPSDPNLITLNPLLMNPGSGATGMNSVDGYKLQSGSPALNSGILVANNGGRDYFGNSVSSSLSPNIGAYNGLASAPTGITSLQEQWMEMFPNPASDVLYIRINENTSGKMLLNIYQITGQKVASYEYCGSVSSIDISHLKEGLYFVELIDGNLKSFRKISIE